MSHFSNAYADPDRAASYSTLGFPATYSLAFRDLPALFAAHGVGPSGGGAEATGAVTARSGTTRRALDFGCGAGRSTRFLGGLGYDVIGVDISAAMLSRARALDEEPGAAERYRRIEDDPSALPPGPFDLVLAAYPFDNIPGVEHRVALLTGLRRRLRGSEARRPASTGGPEDPCGPGDAGDAGAAVQPGRLVLIASSPELYVHEWTTFTTAEWPENAAAGSGERVRIAIKEGGDLRPVDDLRWFDRDYRAGGARGAGGAPPAGHGRRAVRVGQRDRGRAVGDLRGGRQLADVMPPPDPDAEQDHGRRLVDHRQ